ncbi:MAG: rhomboid family intramembrane serine protease [Chitinophagaceae bacterium]|nr:rhomboid family intramembrane serine protease [Chitinophagaceae bacterium]MBL0130949.1 rhomboid family intramembrane serine protease [Chitinophagaceae bacterium]MBL0272747.1 rhomboid family intramembrane serine protease [Chitinophagaceae bacterium]
MSNFRFTRPDRFPPIVKNLIIINVLVWIAQLIYDKKDGLTMFLTQKLALFPINDPEFKPYQVATHMFAHSTYTIQGNIVFFHILFNMFGLYMFGRILENVWGPKKFLIFYLSCGVGAAVTHLAMQYIMGGNAAAVGASGAVMGIFVAFAYLFPNTELMIIPIPFPIKAKWVAIVYILIDLFGGIGQLQGDNIAHFAHLGGALTGFIILIFWNKTNRKTLY